MEKRILKAINEMEMTSYSNFEELMDFWTPDEIIEMWLHYEGIIGYTNTIKEVYELFYMMIPKAI